MSNIKIKFEGFEQIKDKLELIANSIDLREATWEAAQPLLRKTRQLLPMGAKKLANGVRFGWRDNKAQGIVHIMGDYRLKWFEKGTGIRKTKSTGANRGRMKPNWFFKNANAQSKAEVIEIFQKSLSTQIQDIWNERNSNR